MQFLFAVDHRSQTCRCVSRLLEQGSRYFPASAFYRVAALSAEHQGHLWHCMQNNCGIETALEMKFPASHSCLYEEELGIAN